MITSAAQQHFLSAWNDISTYSRSDNDRIPHSWEIKLGAVRVVVTRRIHQQG